MPILKEQGNQLWIIATLRTADAFLDGQLGYTGEPISYLNEMIYLPEHQCYTSGFPLGQSLTALPFAWLKRHGWTDGWRVEWLVAASMAAAAWWAVGLARHAGIGTVRSCWLAAALLFGTWAWTNVAAFDAYLRAVRMPKASAEQLASRTGAIAAALKTTIEVPMHAARSAARGISLCERSVDFLHAFVIADHVLAVTS